MPILLIILMAATGCRKWSDNGDLDAQWQVRQIEWIDSTTVTPANQYISIQLHVVMIDGFRGNMQYNKTGKKLHFDFPYADRDGEYYILNRFGIFTQQVTYDILKLDSKELIIKNKKVIIKCRRY